MGLGKPLPSEMLMPRAMRGSNTNHLYVSQPVQDQCHNFGAGYFVKDNTWNKYHQTFTYYSGVYVIRGRGALISAEGVRHELQPGCFLQRIPDREHTTLVYPGEPWHEVYINLPGKMFKALAEHRLLAGDRDVLHPGEQDRWLQEAIEFIDVLSKCPQYAIPSMVVQAISMLQRIMDEDRNRDINVNERKMEKALALLCSNPLVKLSIQEIAEQVGIGYEYFRKQFKQKYGMSPAQYRIVHRVEAAKQWLQAGNSVKHVAYMMGYCDEFAFSKQFKQQAGMSPQQFLRSDGPRQ